MRLIKPKFWETKNFISYILYPLSIITYLINNVKKISIRKNFEIKTICIGNIFIGHHFQILNSLSYFGFVELQAIHIGLLHPMPVCFFKSSLGTEGRV